MKRSIQSFVLILLVVVLVFPSSVFEVSAYKSGTHEFIFGQAKKILRNDGYESIAEFLDSVDSDSGLSYLKIMEKGSSEHDDTASAREHYMDPMDHHGLDILGFLFKSAGALCLERFNEAVSHWKAGNFYEAAYDLGWAAHLVQDVCVPHHAWYTFLDWHSEYEDWVNSNKQLYAVDSGGIYSFSSFPDRQYYPTYNSGPPSQAYWHYDGENPTAYDWVDYNAHESIKYFRFVDGNNDTSTSITDAASSYAQTVHPLANNLDSNFTFPQVGGWIRLYFEKISMENGYDYIRLYDYYDNLLETFTGEYNGFWTSWYDCVPPMKIRVTTDLSVQSWGYKITQVQYGSWYDALDYVTGILLPQAQRTTAGFVKFFFDNVLNPINIRPDGSIDPPLSSIQRNGDTYTFMTNVYNPIVVDKDDVLIDGNHLNLQATYSGGDGIRISSRSNVTIRNTTVRGFWTGVAIWNSTLIVLHDNHITDNENKAISLSRSSSSYVDGNNITDGGYGICLDSASSNYVGGNNITGNQEWGVLFEDFSEDNVLMENRISNVLGIGMYTSSNCNSILGNRIESGYLYNVYISSSSNNAFYHNNFRGSWYMVNTDSNNTWDNSYPSGGNYWDDYTGTDTDNDGIGDTPYVVDRNNQDNFPLMNPWVSPDVAVLNVSTSRMVVCQGFEVNITAVFKNHGNKIEEFNATFYANNTIVVSQSYLLKGGDSAVYTFAWTVTGLSVGNYTLETSISVLQGEIDTFDNNYTGPWIIVSIVGDVTGHDGFPDGKVGMMDIGYVAKRFGCHPGDPLWDPVADINSDGKIDMKDIGAVAYHFGEVAP